MKILIGINTLTSVDQLVYTNHINFFYRLGKNHPDIFFGVNIPRRSTIDRMRNFTAKVALEHNFDYIMFIDDDVLVPVSNALDKMLKADKDIIAGHTVIRGYPFNNMFFKRDGLGLRYYNEPVINEDGLIECDAVGFSFVLIKCELLKKVPPPFFVTGTHNTEDVYFCVKAREYVKDCSIFVDPSIKTEHILGSETIGPDNREAYKTYFKEAYKDLAIDDTPVVARGDGYLKMVKEPTVENMRLFNAQGS